MVMVETIRHVETPPVAWGYRELGNDGGDSGGSGGCVEPFPSSGIRWNWGSFSVSNAFPFETARKTRYE